MKLQSDFKRSHELMLEGKYTVNKFCHNNSCHGYSVYLEVCKLSQGIRLQIRFISRAKTGLNKTNVPIINTSNPSHNSHAVVINV